MPTVNIEPSTTHPVPFSTEDEVPTTFVEEVAVAGATAELQVALGAPLEVDESTAEKEKTLLQQAITKRKASGLQSPNTAFAAAAFLRTYGQQLAMDVATARSAITNKLMEIANCGDTKFELKALELLGKGKLKRLIINMPPRHTKSEFASYLLPAWFLGKYPGKKIIQCSNTAELAVGFGRKVRNLVDGETYAKIFPNVSLRHDSKAAGRWSTNADGEYFAIGVGGTVTGKGADLLIIDDPHSEQEAALAANDPSIYDKVTEWYTSGPRQRLQPGGAIVIVMTRWGKRDLTGQVLKAEGQRGGESWEVIEFPAILPSGNPLWPEFWSLKELDALKTELPNTKWQAQYQQNPTSEESAIVKREWWRIWEEEDPPTCEFTLMAWDTAFEKSNRADYSACTLWGVFQKADENGIMQSNLILLNALRDRLEFPALKKKVIEEWKDWEPDSMIIEKKASGAPLIYELRAMGIPVQEFTPVKGNDKITRLNAVSDLFASGRVWAPNTHWAEEVVDEVASFPSGEHDDYVDTVSLALMRFRKGGFVRTLLDEEDELPSFKRKFEGYY
jgi:predicted phage terminase large subunit-like protein